MRGEMIRFAGNGGTAPGYRVGPSSGEGGPGLVLLLALYAGQEYPEEFGAVVDFYGVHPNVPIDPAKVRIPVQLHFAKRDGNVPEEKARELAAKLQQGPSEVDSHFYDTDHAFFNDTRPEVHDREAAGLAWKRSVAFLREHLK